MLVADPPLPPPQRNHPRLHTDRLQLRPAHLVRRPRQLRPIDPFLRRHFPAMDLQDLRARLLVGQRELDFAIQTARAEKRRVQHVDAVRRGEDFDAVVGREAVELVEQLEHGALDFAVAGFFAVEAFRAHGVELVDEDDAGGFFFGEREAVAHQFGAVADEHLHELGARELEEGGVCLGGAGAGQEGFACSRGPIHEGAFGGFDADLLEALGFFHRPHDRFDKLFDLLVQAAHVRVFLRRLFVDFHGFDARVVFCGEGVEDEVGVFVDADEVARVKGGVVDEADEWEEDGLAGGGFDYGGLAYSGSVEVDVGAFFGSFFFDIEV